MLLKEKYRGICEIAFTGNRNEVLEITPKGSTKGFAEVTYAKARGVSPEECVHIGDTLNDATCASQCRTTNSYEKFNSEFKNNCRCYFPIHQ